MVKAVSSTTSHQLRASVILGCQSIASARTQASQYQVGRVLHLKSSKLMCFLLGWNLFVAAMTSNQDLSTNLISRVHNRASFNVSAGVFPLSYDSTHGSTILGVAR